VADQDKTEQATPRRLSEARKKGQVAKSTDFSAAVLLFGMVVFLYISRESFLSALSQYMTSYFAAVGSLARQQASPLQLLIGTVLTLARMLAPFLVAGVVLAVLVNVLQTGAVFSTESITPKLSKINPFEGLKRIFSTRGMVESGKSILKVFTIGLVAFLVIRSHLESLLSTFRQEPVGSFDTAASLLWQVFLYGSFAYLALAILDYWYQRYMHGKNLRMSRQEIRDEMRQYEGDPHVRGKQRQMRRRLLQNIIRKAVPRATVVVTNPTHLAVALSYEIGDAGAPKVVAKGAGVLADYIRQLAEEHHVPVVENVPVARFLYKYVEVDQEIPGSLYQAVAGILAVIYRKSRKAG